MDLIVQLLNDLKNTYFASRSHTCFLALHCSEIHGSQLFLRSYVVFACFSVILTENKVRSASFSIVVCFKQIGLASRIT